MSNLVSDIMVVGVTWYYVRHGKSAKLQSICDFWIVRPDLLTVTIHDGELLILFLDITRSLIWLSLEGTLYFL